MRASMYLYTCSLSRLSMSRVPYCFIVSLLAQTIAPWQPARVSPESVTAPSSGRMKSDDALRLFSYHPAALHFRKGLGDRPVQVDRMERVGSKAA